MIPVHTFGFLQHLAKQTFADIRSQTGVCEREEEKF